MRPKQRLEQLTQRLRETFSERGCRVEQEFSEVTLVVPREQWLAIANELHDHADFSFEQMIDVCGVDYAAFGQDEWATAEASSSGFGRGQKRDQTLRMEEQGRFAAVYHLLSIQHNQRLRVKVFLDADEPMVDSVITIWSGVEWFEREAFDMYGIMFSGHPDLRRILTDYGFIGYPLRKDFPLTGHVEMRYDAESRRVIYQPVSIEQRPQVPKVVRHTEQSFGGSSDA